MNWKDETSYSQGDKERKPSTWTLRHGGLVITVTSGHIHYRGTGIWVMHCSPWFDTRELKSKAAEPAQSEALELVRAKIKNLHSAFCQ